MLGLPGGAQMEIPRAKVAATEPLKTSLMPTGFGSAAESRATRRSAHLSPHQSARARADHAHRSADAAAAPDVRSARVLGPARHRRPRRRNRCAFCSAPDRRITARTSTIIRSGSIAGRACSRSARMSTVDDRASAFPAAEQLAERRCRRLLQRESRLERAKRRGARRLSQTRRRRGLHSLRGRRRQRSRRSRRTHGTRLHARLAVPPRRVRPGLPGPESPDHARLSDAPLHR